MTRSADALFQEAIAKHQQGRLDQARAFYEQVLAVQPDHAPALSNMGVLLGALGLFDEALASYDKAIAIKPTSPDLLNNRGNVLRELGRAKEAVDSYSRAIEIRPDYAEAFSNRGVVLQELRRLQEAVRDYDKAIAIEPRNAQAFNNRGVVLSELGRLEEAVASYDEAIAIQPAYASALHRRGRVLYELRRLEEAVASYDKAITINPRQADTYNDRGVVLADLRQLDDALASYDKAIAIKPDHAAAFNNRGNALLGLKRLEEAVADYDRAIAIEPRSARPLHNRGQAFQELRNMSAASASYDKAFAIDPDYEFLLGKRIHLRSYQCDWSQLAADLSNLKSGIVLNKRISQPFHVLALTDKPDLHLRVSAIYANSGGRADSALGEFTARKRDGKIRIGYYSADFHDHATSYLAAQLFESHDRRSFELYGFSFGRADKDDAMRQRISAGFDHFIDVAEKSDREVARLSRDLGIDIAVDLKGFTRESRPAIFAARCAPVQVNFLGYPGTMGASYIDYLIADKTLIPESDQVHYAEKIVYLPHSYQVNDATRKISERIFTRQELGLPDDSFVFCCFNNNYKIQPAMFDSWMRILKSIDGSVLWLLQDNPDAAANLRKEAEARGFESDRLVFAHRMKQLDEHLARHRLADLFLDTLPCNAHTTASDALWTGLPVLTCMGRSFAARVAASLLNAIDLPELITHSYETYEAKAIELARNPALLHEIRTKLARNRLSSPLFDGQLFARHIEAAYTAMHERHQAGLAPAHISIDA